MLLELHQSRQFATISLGFELSTSKLKVKRWTLVLPSSIITIYLEPTNVSALLNTVRC